MPGSRNRPSTGENQLTECAMQLYQLVETLRGQHEQAAAMVGLTATQATILTLLAEPISMSQFAEQMDCDRSNITGIVDRLEAKHLVVRSADEADRRVKRIVRTPAGEAAVKSFQHELMKASSLAKLTPKAQQGLLVALAEVQRHATY